MTNIFGCQNEGSNYKKCSFRAVIGVETSLGSEASLELPPELPELHGNRR